MLTAAFSAGQGSKAGGIGYQEECFPTLKAAESGTNMVPSVLCLNDQGASVMDCSENVSGTLRAQEHGRQPLVYENHGIDSRYTGPHKDATDLVVDVAGLDCRNAAENGDLCGTLQKGTSGSSLNSIHPIRNGLLIRRLTPLECERLRASRTAGRIYPVLRTVPVIKRWATVWRYPAWSLSCRGSLPRFYEAQR